MPRNHAIQASFQRAFRRLGVFRGSIRETVDTVVPVQLMGRDHDDTSRPLWSIQTQAGPRAGEFPSTSITSAFDIEIQEIDYETLTAGALPSHVQTLIATPPAFYIPFLTLDSIFSTTVRPRIAFDIGQTLVFAGTNPARLPFFSLLEFGDRLRLVNLPLRRRVVFDPPLILPATMFLVLQGNLLGGIIQTTWWYRELHTFQGV